MLQRSEIFGLTLLRTFRSLEFIWLKFKLKNKTEKGYKFPHITILQVRMTGQINESLILTMQGNRVSQNC